MKYHDIKVFARKLRTNPTKPEEILWKQLKDRKIDGYKFLRQHPLLYDRQGNDLHFFIPDFYCPKARLIIEIDGRIHDDIVEYDKWREEIIRGLNLKVIRFKNEEVEQKLDKVLNGIRDRMKSD